MSHFEAEYQYIQLDRTFHELSEREGESDDIELRRALRVGKRLGWADLVQEYRAILLSEAGTGKTLEMRHAAEVLRAEGNPTFFLRIEYLSENFDEAFEVGTREEFEAWLSSDKEGWLLLDSVDEARLKNPRDFELAIRKMGNRIVSALQRVHILITGRITAWRPKTDLELCSKHFPYEIPQSIPDTPEDEFDGNWAGAVTDKAGEQENRTPFKIVAIDDLEPRQIERFAMARGVEDRKSFLDAVERADAWSFAARPQDLEELVEFWVDHGRIGSRLEIMQNSVERRLEERDQSRAEAHPLSPTRAREGARLVAAAATLAQEQNIRVPDGSANRTGISINAILPDWNDNDRTTLLSRPIFSEAIYGTVRFHHRSVREFLTAEWLAELLRRDTSRRKIEALFFQNQYGLAVVVPTMRPVLPWLALMDEKVRESLRKIAPEVILEGGDPRKLPLETRRTILHEVCGLIASGTSRSNTTDYNAVQRFADNQLAADIKELIVRYSENDDLLSFLLRMVWLGQIQEALPEAMSVALSAAASKYTRVAAFRAVCAVGTPEDVERIRTTFVNEADELDREWLAELVGDLEPTEENADWLLLCLSKTKDEEPYHVDGLSDAVVEFVQSL